MAKIYSPPHYSQIYYPPHYRPATADPEILCRGNMLNAAHRHFEQFTSTVSSPILSSIPPPHLILATVPYSAILQVQRVTTRRAVVPYCTLCKANCGVCTARTWWSGVKCAGPLICVKCKVRAGPLIWEKYCPQIVTAAAAALSPTTKQKSPSPLPYHLSYN